MSETLVKIEQASKKFCKDLKTGLWYGIKDVFGELSGRNDGERAALRDKEFWAVSDVSVELRRGECLGLIGHNGAGKSTLLKMLNGLIKPDTGRIEIRGRTGALIELGAGFSPVLTGRENIYVNGSVLGFSKDEIDKKLETIVEFSGLSEFINTPVQYYSSGMKVRLGFAIAVQMEPDVLIIDEVLAVGDAAFRVKCFNAICELLPETAIIFVSHNMPQISRICTHVMLMDHGTVCYQGNNIGFGISEYFKRLNIKNIKTVQGNGKAEIIEVSIKNPAGSKVSELDYLDALKIELVYKLLEPVATISFLIVIRNEEQIPVIQIKSPELKTDSMTPQQALTINTMIGKLQLNPGKYVMTTSILQGKSDQLLCVCRDVCEFTVRGDEIGYAPILMDAVWYDSEMKNLSSAHSLDNDWHSQPVNHPGHGE